MRSFFIYLLISFLLATYSCSNKKCEKVFMEKALDSLLSCFIRENPNDHIFSLLFYSKNGRQFMEITSFEKYYNSDFVENTFYKDGHLVCCYSINRSWADNLLYVPKSLSCTDSLKNYHDFRSQSVDYDRPLNTKTYRIFNREKILLAKNEDFVPKKKACDTNVIKDRHINTILNRFINEYDPIITYIRFKHIRHKRYMCIGDDIVYEKKDFVGMFYRNGKIVVLYSDNNKVDGNIIEAKSLKPVKELSDYHIIHRDYPVYSQEEYQLKPDTIVKVKYEDPDYMNAKFN